MKTQTQTATHTSIPLRLGLDHATVCLRVCLCLRNVVRLYLPVHVCLNALTHLCFLCMCVSASVCVCACVFVCQPRSREVGSARLLPHADTGGDIKINTHRHTHAIAKGGREAEDCTRSHSSHLVPSQPQASLPNTTGTPLRQNAHPPPPTGPEPLLLPWDLLLLPWDLLLLISPFTSLLVSLPSPPRRSAASTSLIQLLHVSSPPPASNKKRNETHLMVPVIESDRSCDSRGRPTGIHS